MFIYLSEAAPKYGLDRKSERTKQCVTQLTVPLVHPLILHSSPTQNASVSVSHTNTLQQEVSVTAQHSEPNIHTSTAKSLLTHHTGLLRHESHIVLFHFRRNHCDIFVLTRYTVYNHTCIAQHARCIMITQETFFVALKL